MFYCSENLIRNGGVFICANAAGNVRAAADHQGG